MYQIEKKFTLPIGHRLSLNKNKDYLCRSIHGHNLCILIGVSSKKLNNSDMVIDFADLKKSAKEILDSWDHCLFLNEKDEKIEELVESLEMRLFTFDFDPTAEKLSETLYKILKPRLKAQYNIKLDYISIYENENSKATYLEK